MNLFNVFDRDRREIDGPVNVLRLEGDIDGQGKVIYLFMDHHLAPDQQTECLNVFAQDVNKYFAQSFKELDGSSKVYDFFVETDSWTTKIDPARRKAAIRESMGAVSRGKYLNRVQALLFSAIEYNPATQQVGRSKIFQNVRFHFLDIREEFQNIIDQSRWLSDDLWQGLCSRNGNLEQSIDMLHRIKEIINGFVKAYDQVVSKPGPSAPVSKSRAQQNDRAYPLFEQSVRKVLYRYNHKNVQRIISKIFNEQYKQFTLISKTADKLINDYTKIQRSFNNPSISLDKGWEQYYVDELNMFLSLMKDAIVQATDLRKDVMDTTMWFTDCYLLRRVLDKDYITNAVIYSGSAHSIDYIRVLVGHFNFKITHVTYSTAGSVSKLNAEISKRVKANRSIDDLIAPPIVAAQCSDITEFPKNFS